MNSSKILRRAKREHNRSNLSDFQFLLSSMQREKQRENKENHEDNTHNAHNLNANKINFHPSVKPFFHEAKDNNIPPANHDHFLDQLLYQIKKYLSLTDDMLYNHQKNTEKSKKQAIKVAEELIEMIRNFQVNKEKEIKQKQIKQSMLMSTQAPSSIKLGSNKSLSSSYHFPNGFIEPQYIKKITNLESEKVQLESLISQHERANIKMFIKLNEGESEEIQIYKRQLSSLFQKYKQLEKMVKQQTKNALELKIQLSQKSREIQQLQTNRDLGKEKQQKGRRSEGRKKESPEVKNLKDRLHQMQSIINEQNLELQKAISKVNDLMNRQAQYKNREKHFQSVIQRLQVQKEHLKKSSFSNSQCSFQQLPKKEQEFYRMLLAQAQSLTDLLHS